MSSVLVIDGTGRGHALCEMFTRTDPEVTVFYGPGCDLIEDPRIVPVSSVSLTDPATALRFLSAQPVEFTFVSNIDALSRGYVDVLRAAGHRVVGPTREAARLESSKERGKAFCLANDVPTAEYRHFIDPVSAKAYIRSLPYACVVKTDGLTPDGDGAVVCDTAAAAAAAVDAFARVADRAGEPFEAVVEERLNGTEISVFALLDGDSYLMFPTAADFKRTLEQDAGKNCDGMGSVSPHPADSPELHEEIRRTLLEPVLAGIRKEGLDYSGFLYVGAMMTDAGLRVIEINARFGDSEAEAVLPGVVSDFTALCRAVLDRELHLQELRTDGLARCSVALTQGCLEPADPAALPGWPFGAFATGQPVSGLDRVDRSEASVFYANIRRDSSDNPGGGLPVSSGGRVLHVVGSAPTPGQARELAYRQIQRVSFPGMRYRGDIGAAGTTASTSTSTEHLVTVP
jgi:phosphoribosylamine--glycine ligase